jgi:hypothetical protein
LAVPFLTMSSGWGPRARTLAKVKHLLGGVALAAACSDAGYAVVDPMPPPARCETPISLLKGNVRFEKQADGSYHLVALVVLPENSDLRFSATIPPAAPAHQLSHRGDANGLELRAPIAAIDKAFNATIFLDCGDPANATVAAFWAEGDPAAGSVVPLQINGQPSYRGGAD